MSDINKIWTKVLETIKPEILPVSYSTWIEPIVPVSDNNNTFVLEVANEWNRTMIEERYKDLIKNALMILTNNDYSVEINIVNNDTEKKALQKDEFSKKNVSFMGLNSEYRFDNFIIGDSNKVAQAAANAVASACIANSPCDYNPLFLFSGAGLGKTHLMHAVGNKILSEAPDRKVLYVTSEQFTNDLINAITTNTNQEFRKKYRTVDILMIDDIQFISKREGIQQEIFHTFNDLFQDKKFIIISCDKPPRELFGIEERLITRFASGVVYEIQSPDFETRVAILKKKAEQLNIEVSDDICHYIADNVTKSNRELESTMKMIVSYHRLMNREVTLALAKEALKDYITDSAGVVTADSICEIIERYFNLEKNDLKLKTRAKKISYPRQIAMYFMKKLIDMNLNNIGMYFNGMDHSSIIHNIKKIENDIQTDSVFAQKIEMLKKDIIN